MLDVALKRRFYRYKNGRIPANIYNVYQLLGEYEHELGFFGKNLDGTVICLRAGRGCIIVGKRFGEIEHYRIQAFVEELLGSTPSYDTVRRVIDMISDDYLVANKTASIVLAAGGDCVEC